MNRVRLAIAGAAMVLCAACGGPYSDAAQQLDPLTATRTSTSAPRSTSSRPANQRLLGDGLMVAVSAPKSFTPTSAANPGSPRAVAFDLIIENGTTSIYRPARLSVTALVNGDNAVQVVDSTQGYTGFFGTADEVPPGSNVRVVVAFAVPVKPADLRLIIEPDSAAGNAVTVFEGTV